MTETTSQSTAAEANAKRTIIGVGLATLLGQHAIGTSSPPAQELSIQVSGEIACEPQQRSTKRQPTAKIVRSSPVFPPMPDGRRRWKLTVLAASGLGLSI